MAAEGATGSSTGDRTNSEPLRADVYRVIQAAQERFAYFFLAASGSAIAFALVRTEGATPGCWMLPVSIGVLAWGISFVLGCEHLLLRSKILLANWRVIDIRRGDEPITAEHPELAQPAVQRLRENAGRDNARSRLYGRWQYLTFLLGAILYIIGHVQRTWMR